ncbi:ABC transporter permease [Campylobacter sp. FMV-PI01]|uniref:ABC transporter permease n=1 Tax=Campylobacter portucalensis TaxID=2608384 RepID=A0A6L5WLW4_9BACT|nr:ABC transporter permease [Campylobacter portucalensis]MSN97005.1 ABC transporter permease [Campylobacter portucalensis]
MKSFKKYILLYFILIIWEIFVNLNIIDRLILPSPLDVIKAFITDFNLLLMHSYHTLMVAFLGIGISIIFSFMLSLIMDRYKIVYELIYPIALLSQTIPTVAIAPLLIIWLGYYMKPKIVLVILSTFFPLLVSLLEGYKSIDKDSLNLFKSMGASKFQIYKHLKIPSSFRYFLSGLKVSMSYALISAVIAEWLGGYYGLGVYMTRVKKAFAIDKMFAVIFLISFLSLILMNLIDKLEKKIIKY